MTFSDDARAVTEMLNGLDGVVPAAHSYGDTVITAATGPHPSVCELTCVVPGAPGSGESLAAAAAAAAGQDQGSSPGPVAREDGRLAFSAKITRQALFNDCSDERTQEATATPAAANSAGAAQPIGVADLPPGESPRRWSARGPGGAASRTAVWQRVRQPRPARQPTTGSGKSPARRTAGAPVRELPFQIHPEIGPREAPAPHRRGPICEALPAAAEEAHPPPPCVLSASIPYSRPALALADLVRARAAGVTGIPAWMIDGRLVVGLQPVQIARTEGRTVRRTVNWKGVTRWVFSPGRSGAR